MWNKYGNLAGIAVLKMISGLPFRILYLLSDVMFVLIYYIFRYRRKVVQTNLEKSFPEKSQRELKKIEYNYYRYLCDLAIEALKTGNMSKDEISARMIIRNPEMVNQFYERGKSVVVMAMHYGNWEWLMNMPLFIKHHHYFVYKPLQNVWFDRYLNGLRSRFGGETISMSIALRKIIEADKQNIPVLTWLAADQTPPWFHPFRTMFLQQETQFFDGPAKIAKRFNQPVLFQHMARTKRGYYETWFEVLAEDPSEFTETEIILAYVKKVEEVIMREPAYYLWSHRRWKHTRHGHAPVIPTPDNIR